MRPQALLALALCASAGASGTRGVTETVFPRTRLEAQANATASTLAHVLTNSAAASQEAAARVHAITGVARAARAKQQADGRAKRAMLNALVSGGRVDAARAFAVRGGGCGRGHQGPAGGTW